MKEETHEEGYVVVCPAGHFFFFFSRKKKRDQYRKLAQISLWVGAAGHRQVIGQDIVIGRRLSYVWHAPFVRHSKHDHTQTRSAGLLEI